MWFVCHAAILTDESKIAVTIFGEIDGWVNFSQSQIDKRIKNVKTTTSNIYLLILMNPQEPFYGRCLLFFLLMPEPGWLMLRQCGILCFFMHWHTRRYVLWITSLICFAEAVIQWLVPAQTFAIILTHNVLIATWKQQLIILNSRCCCESTNASDRLKWSAAVFCVAI